MAAYVFAAKPAGSAEPALAPVPLSAARTAEGVFYSPSLGVDVPYLVFLPPGYDSNPQARYPVLYLLHGLGGDRYQWQNIGVFARATEMMSAGEIEPFIIVTPEGKSAYWVDHANGGPRWGTYVSQDMINFVDGNYRTLEGAEARAIGGISMGAHGALQLALNSQQFSIVGAHSVALRNYQEAFPFFGDRSYFEAHDPVSLCKQYGSRARDLWLWIDIGDGDPWVQRATSFHEQLLSSAIPHEWHVYPGSHDFAYWQAHVREYLYFYNSAFIYNQTHGSQVRTGGERADTN